MIIIKHILTILIFYSHCFRADVFGIYEKYPSRRNFEHWDSQHWNNNHARELYFLSHDPDDPTGRSQKRGKGTFKIDGNGVLEMGGKEPRIYINDKPNHKFINTETTIYYKRSGTDGTDWSGLIIGCRSTSYGHSSVGRKATTYYARLQHNGKVDFSKELVHSYSEYYWKGLHKKGVFYTTGVLPSNKWIGMKFIVFTPLNDNTVTKLELYLDTTTEGDTNLIGTASNWVKIGEMLDNGNFPVKIKSDGTKDNKVIIEGSGTVFIRNTGIAAAYYKWFSVREITCSFTTSSSSSSSVSSEQNSSAFITMFKWWHFISLIYR